MTANIYTEGSVFNSWWLYSLRNSYNAERSGFCFPCVCLSALKNWINAARKSLLIGMNALWWILKICNDSLLAADNGIVTLDTRSINCTQSTSHIFVAAPTFYYRRLSKSYWLLPPRITAVWIANQTSAAQRPPWEHLCVDSVTLCVTARCANVNGDYCMLLVYFNTFQPWLAV